MISITLNPFLSLRPFEFVVQDDFLPKGPALRFNGNEQRCPFFFPCLLLIEIPSDKPFLPTLLTSANSTCGRRRGFVIQYDVLYAFVEEFANVNLKRYYSDEIL